MQKLDMTRKQKNVAEVGTMLLRRTFILAAMCTDDSMERNVRRSSERGGPKAVRCDSKGKNIKVEESSLRMS